LLHPLGTIEFADIASILDRQLRVIGPWTHFGSVCRLMWTT